MADIKDDNDAIPNIFREPSFEDNLVLLRQQFGNKLAAEVEKWALVGRFPDTVVEVLVEDLAKHIDTMTFIFSRPDLSKEERAKAVTRIALRVNDLIASECKI